MNPAFGCACKKCKDLLLADQAFQMCVIATRPTPKAILNDLLLELRTVRMPTVRFKCLLAACCLHGIMESTMQLTFFQS